MELLFLSSLDRLILIGLKLVVCNCVVKFMVVIGSIMFRLLEMVLSLNMNVLVLLIIIVLGNSVDNCFCVVVLNVGG